MASLAHSPHTSLPKLGHKAGAGQLMPRGTHYQACTSKPGRALGMQRGHLVGGERVAQCPNWDAEAQQERPRGHLVGGARVPPCPNWGMKCTTGSARGHLVGGDSQWYKRGHLEGAASRARP